jgi:hypothetical protein
VDIVPKIEDEDDKHTPSAVKRRGEPFSERGTDEHRSWLNSTLSTSGSRYLPLELLAMARQLP